MNRYLIISGIVVLLICVGLSGCTTEQYSTYDGGTSQRSTVYLPWDITYHSMHSGDFVYISAQNNGEHGSVKAEIYVDGELFKTSYSFGAYVIASSSGILE